MAAKSKKQNANTRAQKRKRKEEKRRKQRAKAAQLNSSRGTIGQRHRKQLQSLIPKAWDGENPLDVAVFDETVFSTLSAEQHGEVASVKNSLQLIECGKLDEANEAVANIPRKSGMSDWRMLIRGITSWLENDLAAAEASWSRLDVDRRPARIARALQLAHRDDLPELAAGTESQSNKNENGGSENSTEDNVGQSNVTAWVNLLDRELLQAARIVRRMRIDRAAIKIAAVGVNQKLKFEDKIPDTTITPEKIKWLREFANDFRDLEPNLVRALEIAALDRASAQPYTDVFADAVKAFRGPVHDPRNLFRSFCYSVEDDDSEESSDGFLRKYVETDLPFNEQLSKSLRNAMISTIWLREATYELEQFSKARSPFNFAFRSGNDDRVVRKTIQENFQKSIKAFPRNAAAHEAYVDSLERDVDDDNLTKKQREQATTRLTDAMKLWAQAIPTAPQPRTYLAETLLEAEQFEDAGPHIEWIINSRPDDPRLKALAWKSKLFEVMNLCRRKSNLSQVPDVLEEVNTLWPNWLSKRWLPYFTAAWLLRSGDQAGFQKQRESIYASGAVTRDSLADACMMLGAAQKMKVPAADLKPLRQPIDSAVKNVKQLSTEDLLDAGSFFWEMVQARVHYPAFRMHGSKFGREVLRRFKGNPGLLNKHIDEPAFRQSVFWCSEHRFWGDGYESKMPISFKKLVTTNVCMAAAHLNGMIKVRYGAANGQLLETSEFLREAIRSETSPFYRFWFAELASAGEEKHRQFENDDGFGDLGNMFGSMFGNMFGQSTDDDDDGECNCEKCQAKRARKEASSQQAKPKPQTEESREKQDDRQNQLF